MNMFGNLGGTLSPVVVGLSIDRLGSWNAPLFSIAALYLVSAACWLAVDPAEKIGAEENSRHVR